MRSVEEINKKWFRQILDGTEYDALFPESDCKIIEKRPGGYFQLDKIVAKWIIKFKDQTNNISKLLKKESLYETVDAVHWFLHDHIQYKTRRPQEILSPACAWHSRKEGTNCNSYTIFASTILLNLGIKHYLRSVVYNEDMSHIYVVVPKDQKKAVIDMESKFNEDYYIIDGSSGINKIEHPFISNHDTYMYPNYIRDKNMTYGLFAFVILLTLINKPQNS